MAKKRIEHALQAQVKPRLSRQAFLGPGETQECHALPSVLEMSEQYGRSCVRQQARARTHKRRSQQPSRYFCQALHLQFDIYFSLSSQRNLPGCAMFEYGGLRYRCSLVFALQKCSFTYKCRSCVYGCLRSRHIKYCADCCMLLQPSAVEAMHAASFKRGWSNESSCAASGPVLKQGLH